VAKCVCVCVCWMCCVSWVSACVGYPMFHGSTCVLDMLCLLGECVVCVSACARVSVCVGYVMFDG